MQTTISSFIDTKWRIAICCLILLIIVVVIGNFFVMVIITCDQKLRRLTTNKFIASLAVSDLLVGIVVMPLSLYEKFYGNKWVLGFGWCQFHLITFIFSTTASIIHLVAISIDRYFAIMFPTEYQRHSITTSVVPYLIMIWGVSFAVSSTLLMEQNLDANDVCWIENSQYLVLSSLLSFFVPGVIVVYLYMKIFIQLHNHRLYMCGKISRQQGQEKTAKRSLPRVIIEEVRFLLFFIND
ncbi:unnamed protein product [Dracunculus medinensis]|uniref:G-protein coupled receptors family 1 profile domain-containing protein n=1 Tax=Dracunculus medinensis TaxID=318479 RepID=A0A3P7PKE8_DRAME|nr:unnamed protein product [Dracunculus medinensis]